MPNGKTLIDTDLKFKMVGESVGALSNVILLSQRMEVSAKNIRDEFRGSKFTIEQIRNIIKTYETLSPYIETLKKIDDVSSETHNKLYGEPEK